MMSSQDGSQCEHRGKKGREKEVEKGLFFRLAGDRSPIGLFLFLLHASALLVPSFPVSVVRNSGRVKLRAAFSHQTSNASHAQPSDPDTFVTALAEAARCIPKLAKRVMGKRDAERRGHQSVHHTYWFPKCSF